MRFWYFLHLQAVKAKASLCSLARDFAARTNTEGTQMKIKAKIEASIPITELGILTFKV